MEHIHIELQDRSYDVHVGFDSVGQFSAILKQVFTGTKLLIVTDENLQKHWLDDVQASLEQAGFEVDVISIASGEMSKSMENAVTIWDKLIDDGHTRESALLALGGGVISDLTGFVAAGFMRGIKHANIPTSMMGQLDAAIGGKTAVNFPQAKNIVGSFKQPAVVLTDTKFMQTLPRRELSSGLAEAVKYALLIGDEFFDFIETNASDIYALEAKTITKTLMTCIGFKSKLIEIDECDRSERMVLNLGHTLGHSIEKMGGYGQFRHGEAVAIGLVFSTWLSAQRGVLKCPNLLERVQNLLQVFDLPVSLPKFSCEDILDVMRRDKKVSSGDHIRFILSPCPGETVYQQIPANEVLGYLQEFSGS